VDCPYSVNYSFLVNSVFTFYYGLRLPFFVNFGTEPQHTRMKWKSSRRANYVVVQSNMAPCGPRGRNNKPDQRDQMVLSFTFIAGPPKGPVLFCTLSASSVVCNAAGVRAHNTGGRKRGRSGGRHCTAGLYGYVPLVRHLVLLQYGMFRFTVGCFLWSHQYRAKWLTGKNVSGMTYCQVARKTLTWSINPKRWQDENIRGMANYAFAKRQWREGIV